MTETQQKPIPEAFIAVAELGYALGVRDIVSMEGCWEHQVDDDWRVAVNAHDEQCDTSWGDRVPPRTVYVTWKEWPAAFFTSGGGTFVTSATANEDAFLAAVRAAMPKD